MIRPLLASFVFLAAGCSTTPPQLVELPKENEYMIDVKSNIALHRVFNVQGDTYLEFLDAKRMNPVITGVDGVPMEYRWNDRFVVLAGVQDNLTVTTPYGVAHVYAKLPAPPARVAAPTPPRALEYGVEVPAVQPPAPSNYNLAELPAVGDSLDADRYSVTVDASFMGSLTDSQASQILGAARVADHVTISAQVPKRAAKRDAKREAVHTERAALAFMSEARQFLMDNGVAEYKIRTARVSQSATAKSAQVDFLVSN